MIRGARFNLGFNIGRRWRPRAHAVGRYTGLPLFVSYLSTGLHRSLCAFVRYAGYWSAVGDWKRVSQLPPALAGGQWGDLDRGLQPWAVGLKPEDQIGIADH